MPVLFAAIPVPEEARERAIAAVRPIWPGVGRVDHVTLRYWGEVPDVVPVAALCASVASRFAPPELVLAGGGGFPHARAPRVLWMGVQGELAPIAAALGAERFQAHLTVGRVRRGRAGREAMRLAALPEVARFTAPALVLFRSDAGVHTVVATFPFGG